MDSKSNVPPRSIVVQNDYRLTRREDGIKIEVLNYHARPLVLTDEIFEQLGMKTSVIR